MKEIIQHHIYGEIIYNESFWTGKKTLKINNEIANPISKNEFIINDKKICIKGNFFMGISAHIDNEILEISQKTKWYEYVLSIIPFLFLMIWGNNVALCSIFPVVGGAIGGALGGISAYASLLFMKKAKNLLYKILIGLSIIAFTILIAFILALLIINILS